MDLRQLRYFAVVADTLNFHRAAERLNISQPPLTVAIRKLEEELGARLFDRESRGVRLTEAGRAALPVVHATLKQAESVREAVKRGRDGTTGILSVGFVGSATTAVLPRIIPTFRKSYPGVDLRLNEMTSVSIADALTEGRIDVGLVRLPLMDASDLDIGVIERDRLVVALSAAHPMAWRSTLALADLAEEQHIVHGPVSVLRSIVLLACRSAGFSPVIVQEATQVQTILSLVQSGLGIALVPSATKSVAPNDVHLIPLVERLNVELALVTRRNADVLARNFVSVAGATIDIQTVSV
jgi:DNA-binding transcriptional LysR family regulator